MRINTLGRKKIQFIYFFLTFFGLVFHSFAQCPTVSQPSQSFCDLESPTVSNLVATSGGNGIVWYATATSTTPLSGAAGLINGEDYFADDITGACGVRPSVVVTIFSAPTGLSFQGVCVDAANSATLASLIVNGNAIQWYDQQTNGSLLTLSTILTDENIYYASQTNPNTGCETSRLSVFVNVGVVPEPIGAAIQEFCNDPSNPPTVADLVATIPLTASIRWYSTISSASPLALSTVLINGEDYYATSVDPPCQSASRFQVNVTLISPNDPGTSAQRRICISAIPTFPPFNLFSELGGSPDATGTWSGPLPTNNGHLGTVNISTLTIAGSPYVFTYTVTSSVCSIAAATVTIVVLPLPTATISGNVSICSGTNATVTFNGTPNATVSFTVNGSNQTIILNSVGVATLANTYSANAIFNLVSVASAGVPSCTQNVSGTITINILALPTVTVSSLPVCIGTNATVTATPGTPGNYSFAWTVPGGAINPGNVATFTTAFAGIYSVIITNTTTNCISLSAATTVVINPLPTVTVNSPSVCAGLSATVTASSGSPGAYTYVWTVPLGFTNPGNVATFTTTVTGTYSVIITNSTTTCPSASAAGIVTVNPLPTVTVNSPLVCAGNSATVTATPGTPGTYSFAWTVPAAATNPGNVATFTTSVAGTYSVIITNTITTCSSLSASGLVTINPLPTVTVSSPPVCAGTNAIVTATPGIAGTYSFAWTVPAGATAPGNVASFSTSVAGTYSVIITNTVSNCPSASASGIVVINPLPTVTVNSSSICPGVNATITATPGIPGAYNYVWTVPIGFANPGNVATFPTNIAGVYSVIITNQTTTCPSASASGTVTINPLPTVTVNSPSICAGLSATVTATPGTPGNYSFIWTVPVGAINPGNIATFATSIAGTYSVVITNTITNCSSASASAIVTLNPLPTVSVTSSLICAGENATVTATPGIVGNYSFVWTVPVGVTNPGNVPSFSTTIAGVYSVVITNISTTCPSLAGSGTVTIIPSPVVTITSTSLCSGVDSTITAIPAIPGTYSFAWTVPVGVPDPGNVSTFTTAIAGIYSVVITDLITTCESTSAATVTINEEPTVTVNSPSICPGVAATLIATPTPNGSYSYVWTVPLGATDPGNVATFTTLVIGTYSVIITNLTTSCVSESGFGTVNTSPIPNVTVESLPVCAGSNATVTAIPATGMPADYSYVWTVPVGAVNPGNVASFSTAIAGTYSVIITNVTTTCVSSSASGTLVINQLPTVTVSSSSICAGSTATLTASSGSGLPTDYSYAWIVPVGVVNPGNVSSFMTSIGGIYSVIITNLATSCVSVLASGTVTTNPLPTVTISASGTVCSGNNTVVTFTGTPNSIVTYTINSGSDQIINIGASGVATLNTALTVTSIFNLVSIALVNPPSCTQLQSGTVTINVTQPPVAGSNGAITLCSIGNSQDLFLLLGNSPQAGGTWSPVLDSGTGLFNPAVDAPGSYIYTVAGTPPCVNDTALVTVTIIPAANAGTDGLANLCSNADAIDLITFLMGAPQAGGTWSPTLTSGTGLFDPSIDVAGVYTYTVNGLAPCLGDAASVTVTITPGPNAGISGSTTLCVNSPSQDLFLSLSGNPQVGGTWSPALSSGTGVFDPILDTAGVYTYTFSGNQPCDDDTATVTVTVNPLPDAGDDNTTNVCSNVDPIDLITRLGGTPQSGGTWTPPLASGTSFFNPAIDLAGIYTYTVGAPFCTPDIAVLTVIIVPGPDAGQNGDVTFCITDSAQDLFLSLNGTPQVGGTWSPTLTSGSGVFDPAVDIAGVYTYTFAGNQPCDDDTATVTVVVNPLASAGAFTGIQEVCNAITNFDLFTLLTGNQLGGVWTDTNNDTVTNPIAISGFAANTYNYTYTVSNGCGPDDTEQVQFTVLPNPTLDATNIAISSPNCVGSPVVVTFSGMIDATYTFNFNLSLSNILVNQNANVTIIGGNGTYVIDAATIPNIGTTRITFLNIINDDSSCSSPINPNVSADFILQPSSNLENTNLSIINVCNGVDATVLISGATGLSDGDYQFGFNLPEANPTTGTTATVSITGGVGQFSIPLSFLTNSGIYNLTITSITSLSGACNNLAEDAATSFEVYPILNLTAATITAANACLNFSNDVIILVDSSVSGNYTINYQLSGASQATNSELVTFTNGEAIFVIPATDINTTGTVTVTVTDFISEEGLCNTNGTTISPITFEVESVATPELLTNGNQFCGTENPTVSDLSTGISGTEPLIWYTADSGGSPYNASDLLIDGTTYYGAFIAASGCESNVRVAVIVDLDFCEILIPDGFSPNGDTVNDTFEIKNLIERYPNFKLEIYNRYGNILYKGNRDTLFWNGTSSEGGIKIGNNEVPVGVYFYILEFNDGILKDKQGRLYLSR